MVGPPEPFRNPQAEKGPRIMEYGLDLDADDIADWWESAPQFCDSDSNCVRAVYLRHGGCGQLVGYLFGGNFALSGFRHNGLYDVEARIGRSESHTLVRYEYDGREYVRVAEQACHSNPLKEVRCKEPIRVDYMPLGDDLWHALDGGAPDPK